MWEDVGGTPIAECKPRSKPRAPIHDRPKAEAQSPHNTSKQGEHTLTHKVQDGGSHSLRNEAQSRKANTNMGKVLVIILATCAALGIMVHLFGGARLASTALTIPGTDHTPTFGITWTVLGALLIGGIFYKLVKGK
jgi:hypothetical protein